MNFSAARIRTVRYYSRPRSPECAEQQCTQEREEIQGKLCETPKNLTEEKLTKEKKTLDIWWQQLTFIFLIRIAARGNMSEQNEHKCCEFLRQKIYCLISNKSTSAILLCKSMFYHFQDFAGNSYSVTLVRLQISGFIPSTSF